MTKRYLRYALVVIFTANFLSYLDRQIIGALEKELTDPRSLALTKTEFGVLHSAFTIGYMVFAPIVGFLVARTSRTRIFAVCVVVWSIATIASGFAPNKYVLYATRFFIGIGEAGCLVIGPTLLSDYFPKEMRGRALSVFFLALPLGGTAGYIVGGFLNEIVGWRYTFLLAGLPGFLVAALIWFLVDPPRGGQDEGAHGHGLPPGGGVGSYLDLLRNRTLLLIILAQAFAVMFLQPLLLFGVGFFEDERGFSKQQATTTLGVVALVAGGLGNMLSGVLGDRLAKRGIRGPYALLAGIAFVAGLPCLLLGFTSTERWIFIPALGLGAFFYFLCMPAVNTQIANAVTAHQRAMAYALAVFILHLLGDTGAPPAFGAVADALDSTRQAFFLFSFSLLLAGGSCLLAARTAARDEARAGGTASS
ncbi:MAG TPA: MFS transporter [Planctomycetota bacterium]|nr:MFS transporter [Planctomycetota bacterium]